MFNRERASMIGFILISCAIVVGSTYLATTKNMTGQPYSEIAAYRQAHPYMHVTYSVKIEGEHKSLKLKQDTTSVTVTDQTQAQNLVEHADYLQQLKEIRLGDLTLDIQQLSSLYTAFPNANIQYSTVTILGQTCTSDTTTLDLSALQPQQIQDAANVLRVLPNLKSVNLNGTDGKSTISIADAAQLQSAVPEVKFDYTIDLFGKTVSTDMESLEYFQVPIGDAGLEQFRLLLPMMHDLTYLKLDWCQTSNEAMAQLRDDFPNIKVVWRVFFGQFNCLTDTYKIWATYSVTTQQVEVLKYCTEVKYLDLGHNRIKNCDFVRYMPDLEVAILAETMITDLEPLRSCPKITYLELFGSLVKDITPLEDLVNLEHLNISDLRLKSIAPIYGLNKLERMYCTTKYIPQEQRDEFHRLHPDCVTVYISDQDCTGFYWRYRGGAKVDRYALLTKQIGYDTNDWSIYPRGYVREEINSVT